MQIEEIVDNIAAYFEKTTDHVFKKRVLSNVLAARAEIIRRYIDKYNSYPVSLISQVNCEETEKVDIAECCNSNLNCKITRTKNIIPSPIRKKGLSSAFIYVGTLNNNEAFGYIEPNQIDYILSDRFMPSNKMFYSYINGRIYIINGHPSKVRVRGIFNNPYLINTLNNCNGSDECLGNLEIPDDFVVQIKDIVYKEMSRSSLLDSKEEITLDNDRV